MEIMTAIVMGIVGGLLVKALFLKNSQLSWDAIFGVVGGLVSYYLYTSLTSTATKAVFILGTAVVFAGLLHEIWNRLGKKAA